MKDAKPAAPEWWRWIDNDFGGWWECRFFSSAGALTTRLADLIVSDLGPFAFQNAEERAHSRMCKTAGRPVDLYVMLRAADDAPGGD